MAFPCEIFTTARIFPDLYYCYCLQSVVTLIFWWIVESQSDGRDVERASDSGISASWSSSTVGSSTEEVLGETQPLLSQYRTYTQEKVSYYGKSRKHDQQVLYVY